MKLTLNGEYARRHLFAVLVLLGMGGWFGYDGFVGYPRQTPQELFASCHKGAAAPSDEAAAKFAATAIPRQKQFMGLCLLAAAVVGLRLLKSVRFRFEFDETGFSCGGARLSYADIRDLDDTRWKKKGLLAFTAGGRRITLDAWHHRGVDAFLALYEKQQANEGS